MRGAFSPDGRWRSVVDHVSGVVDLEATAREHGALRRARKLRTGADLLRLALLHGPGGLSLRAAAAAACEAGMAESLSDKAVLGRLRRMGDWLEHVLGCLLAEVGRDLGGGLALVDGTLVFSSGPSSKRGKPGYRVHALYEPALGRFTDFRLTTCRVGEAAGQTRLVAGRTMVFDRGYARVRNIAEVLAAGSDVVTRIGWRALPLCEATPAGAGARLDLIGLLPQAPLSQAPLSQTPLSRDGGVLDRPVRLRGLERPLRLLIAPLPAAPAAAARRRVRRRASKSGKAMLPNSERAAPYLMLVTSLDPARAPADEVLRLYRARWQVELGFKRLKSLGGLDTLRAADPQLARSWLLAHLIAAVLTEDLAGHIAGFPPSAPAPSPA